MEAETLLRKLDRRAQQVEQILPALPTRTEMQEAIDAAVRPLATKEELHTAVAKLATKEELEAAVAKLATKEELTAQVATLATKAEMHEEAELTRRHFDVVAESLRDDIRLIAERDLALQHEVRESKAALQTEVRQGRKELDAILKNHDKRITRLESTETRRRKQR